MEAGLIRAWPWGANFASFSVRSLSHEIVTSSTGKRPARAPHSVVMFAIVKRSSTERCLTPSPTNSIAEFNT